MKIIVDGDGCAGMHIIEKVAKEYKLPLKVFCTYNHNISLNYGNVTFIDVAFQSVDMVVFNETIKNDIVVTQDFGVAAMVIGKKAYALSPKGYIFSNENMDRLLFEKHISAKVRRGGGRTKGSKKRDINDDIRLHENLIKLIKKAISH